MRQAAVDKLADLRAAATKEGFDVDVPDALKCVDKVGTFQALVQHCEMDSDFKFKVWAGWEVTDVGGLD